MISKIKLLYKRFYQKANYDVQKALLLNAKILSNYNNQKQFVKSLDEVEFQVFSQKLISDYNIYPEKPLQEMKIFDTILN